MSLSSDAAAFLALHQPGTPGVFPTVWDPRSAQLAVDNGSAALTVGSHPVATALGRADNEGMTLVEAADSAGVHVVVNARTDILLKGVGEPEGRVDATLEKLRAAADAGADVLYPVGIDKLARLAGLGVARITFGPHWQKAVGVAAAELLAPWKTA